MREISEYLVCLNLPTTLLIFPEGTDLSPSNHLKSLAFAKREGLAEYQYVLHPKVRSVRKHVSLALLYTFCCCTWLGVECKVLVFVEWCRKSLDDMHRFLVLCTIDGSINLKTPIVKGRQHLQ